MCQEQFKRKKLLLEHIGKIHVTAGEAAQAIIRKYDLHTDNDEDIEAEGEDYEEGEVAEVRLRIIKLEFIFTKINIEAED
jgi:hypothetical protein